MDVSFGANQIAIVIIIMIIVIIIMIIHLVKIMQSDWLRANNQYLISTTILEKVAHYTIDFRVRCANQIVHMKKVAYQLNVA